MKWNKRAAKMVRHLSVLQTVIQKTVNKYQDIKSIRKLSGMHFISRFNPDKKQRDIGSRHTPSNKPGQMIFC
jgi:hypothetical protein